MTRKVTIVDIAKHLNVSAGLVSLVLRDKWKENRISEELAKKVKKTAFKLGYQPNVLAQALRTGKSGLIGLILSDISNPYCGEIIKAIEIEATKAGYAVMFGSSDENPIKFKEIGETFISRQVDGLIVVPVTGAEVILADWINYNIPMITINRCCPGLDLPYIMTNNYLASQSITQFIIEKGFKRIAFVTNEGSLNNYAEQEKGFQEIIKKTPKVSCSSEVYRLSKENWNLELRELIPQLLDQYIEVIYFAQNMLGIEGIRIFKELNIRVPVDIRIVCFDNAEVFEQDLLGITCYEQPIKEIATKAITFLIDKLSKDLNIENIKQRLEGKLIIRESC